MKTRKLRDLQVSAIGMGCMGFTHAYGDAPPEKEGIRLVHKAFELGCNFFDTAEMQTRPCWSWFVTMRRKNIAPWHRSALHGFWQAAILLFPFPA